LQYNPQSKKSKTALVAIAQGGTTHDLTQSQGPNAPPQTQHRYRTQTRTPASTTTHYLHAHTSTLPTKEPRTPNPLSRNT
jgi:hypothetical protein